MQNFKVIGLYLCVLVAGVGCKSMAGKQGGNSSSLKGVYDQQHLLRVSEVTPGSSQYHFEACLMESPGTAKEGSCISALKGRFGEGIIFQADFVSSMSLSDAQKQKLETVSADWNEYQKSMVQKRKQGATAASGVGVGGGLLLGGQLMQGRAQAGKRADRLDVLKRDEAQLAQDTQGFEGKQKALDDVLSSLDEGKVQLAEGTKDLKAKWQALDDALASLEEAKQRLVSEEQAEVAARQIELVKAQKNLLAEQAKLEQVFQAFKTRVEGSQSWFDHFGAVSMEEAEKMVARLKKEIVDLGYNPAHAPVPNLGRSWRVEELEYLFSGHHNGLRNDFIMYIADHKLFRSMNLVEGVEDSVPKLSKKGLELFADPWSVSRLGLRASEKKIRYMYETMITDYIVSLGGTQGMRFDTRGIVEVHFHEAFFEFQRVKQKLNPDSVVALKEYDIWKAFRDDPIGMLEDMAALRKWGGVHPEVVRKISKFQKLSKFLALSKKPDAAWLQALDDQKKAQVGVDDAEAKLARKPNNSAIRRARTQIDDAQEIIVQARNAVDQSSLAVEQATALIAKTDASLPELKAAVSKAGQAVEASKTAVSKSRTLFDDAAKALAGFSRGVAGIVLGTAAAVVGVFAATKYFTKDEAQALHTEEEASRSRADNLQVLFDQNSPLFSTDPELNTPVPSVQRVLEDFTAWQKNLWLDVRNSGVQVHHFCLPTAVVEGEVQTDCYWSS